MNDKNTDRDAQLKEAFKDFLSQTNTERHQWHAKCHQLTSKVRVLTGDLIQSLAYDRIRSPEPIFALRETIRREIQHLPRGFLLMSPDAFENLKIWGDGKDHILSRYNFKKILTATLASKNRKMATEAIDLMAEVAIPGLGIHFTAWQYLLHPNIFPPITPAMAKGIEDVLGADPDRNWDNPIYLKQVIHRLWRFTDHFQNDFSDDLGDVAWFLEWIGRHTRTYLGITARMSVMDTSPTRRYSLPELTKDTKLQSKLTDRIIRDILSQKNVLIAGLDSDWMALCFAKYLSDEGDGDYEILKIHGNLSYDELIGTHEDRSIIWSLVKRARQEENNVFVLVLSDVDCADLDFLLGELLLGFRLREEPIYYPRLHKHIEFPDNIYVIATTAHSVETMATTHRHLLKTFKPLDS